MKKFGYYKQGLSQPQLVEEFYADKLKQDKEYVYLYKLPGDGTQQQVAAIHLNKGEWVKEIEE